MCKIIILFLYGVGVFDDFFFSSNPLLCHLKKFSLLSATAQFFHLVLGVIFSSCCPLPCLLSAFHNSHSHNYQTIFTVPRAPSCSHLLPNHFNCLLHCLTHTCYLNCTSYDCIFYFIHPGLSSLLSSVFQFSHLFFSLLLFIGTICRPVVSNVYVLTFPCPKT